MQYQLFEQLKKVLEKDERLVAEGELLRNRIVELARKNDSELLKLLLADKKVKSAFFTEVDGVQVFDSERFVRFVNNKEFLPDSYTAFKNKIGLAEGDEFVSENKDVVLNWPYKDCVLEGGQTKEDVKRDEVFWNETLAPDQVHRLLEPKVFTNWKRFDAKNKNGKDVGALKRADDGTIKDNLIVKGNNLLALHSLKERFAGQIKLIYIDPPFNKNVEAFYNDKFRHSSWLIYVKNRFEVAKELLADDGFICVHLDSIEMAYCKVLLDEVFGRANHRNTITMTTNDPSGFKATGDSVFSTANYILIYSNKEKTPINRTYIETGYDEMYNKVLDDKTASVSKWSWKNIQDVVAKESGFETPKKARKELGAEEFKQRVSEYATSNADRVFRTAAIQGGARQKRIDTIELSRKNKDKVYKHPNDDIEEFYILNGEGIVFYEKKVMEIDGLEVPAQMITDVWTDISWNGIAREGGVTLKNGKKPERLLERVIDMFTKKGDYILDYHLGSGTTCAVAHKMDRLYIGVEQLDYVENSGFNRLLNVIDGDATGISAKYSWKGGGDFVYTELLPLNEKYKEKAEKAKDKKELQKVWGEIQKKGFLSYKLDLKKFDENAKEFADLTLADQKKFILESLDYNQLYVNHSEIDDKDYGVSKEDKELNNEFYG